ncbi:hypothetical protein T440DRAFT_315756 [Plenodomus tracheiphilus IPT5]|uniref:Uncharacterized protein n=1 Tax=Plenodomus tracheiphilus IPT5 TaxID=1408161 RepID=A0A6A7AMY4_9PLEO|nr:hypothetical protein T440DRAFT_315756 [Plenodomus tracheiphilus IPT5]
MNSTITPLVASPAPAQLRFGLSPPGIVRAATARPRPTRPAPSRPAPSLPAASLSSPLSQNLDTASLCDTEDEEEDVDDSDSLIKDLERRVPEEYRAPRLFIGLPRLMKDRNSRQRLNAIRNDGAAFSTINEDVAQPSPTPAVLNYISASHRDSADSSFTALIARINSADAPVEELLNLFLILVLFLFLFLFLLLVWIRLRMLRHYMPEHLPRPLLPGS